MKVEKVVSEVMFNVISNGTKSGSQPSQITMSINHRLAPPASDLFLDLKDGIQPEVGLVGFKLVSIYEDGKDRLDVTEDSETLIRGDDPIEDKTEETTEVEDSTDNIQGSFKEEK